LPTTFSKDAGSNGIVRAKVLETKPRIDF